MGQWVSSNHNNADEYMGSGLPFAEGAISCTNGVGRSVNFPYVTRWVQIFNNHGSNPLRVGFTKNGVEGNPDNNYFVIKAGESSARLELKCIQIWLAGDGGASTASVVAAYTNIPKTKYVPELSGSADFQGVG